MLAILSASQLLDDSAVPPAAAGSVTDTATAVTITGSKSARQLQFSAVSPSSCFKIDQAQLVHATVGEVAIHTLHVLHGRVVRDVSQCIANSCCQCSNSEQHCPDAASYVQWHSDCFSNHYLGNAQYMTTVHHCFDCRIMLIA
jgi:hypothetical protein